MLPVGLGAALPLSSQETLSRTRVAGRRAVLFSAQKSAASGVLLARFCLLAALAPGFSILSLLTYLCVLFWEEGGAWGVFFVVCFEMGSRNCLGVSLNISSVDCLVGTQRLTLNTSEELEPRPLASVD